MTSNNLELFFSPSAPSTVIDSLLATGGTTLYETLNGNLYSDSGLTILAGRIAISQTIFDILDLNMNGKFETTGQAVLVLPNGTIQYIFAGQTIKTPSGKYVFPSTVYTFNITSCTGIYMPMYGQITITSQDSPNGLVLLRKFDVALKWRNSNNYLYT